jgi:hypothetical protein
MSPTSSPKSWAQVAGPYKGSVDLGVSVAMSPSYMAAGATSGSGQVRTYYRLKDGTWSSLSTLFGVQQSGLFGISMDFVRGRDAFAVGAPGTFAVNTETPTGTVFFYQLDPSIEDWSPLGKQLRGAEDRFTAGESFGFSVAVSSNLILAVGAPFNNEDNISRRGRVYTFRFDSNINDWTPRASLAILGDQSGDRLGYAVDLSSDGNVLVAGGIGRNELAGYITVSLWEGSQWRNVNVASAIGTAGESFGSSVKVLSDDGLYIAAGGPGFSGGNGVIRVYKRNTFNNYDLVGAIEGGPGDSLGDYGSLSGTATPNPILLASTASGLIRRLEYDTGSSSFVEIPNTALNVGIQHNATLALGGSPTGDSFVAGGSNQVVIYDLV